MSDRFECKSDRSDIYRQSKIDDFFHFILFFLIHSIDHDNVHDSNEL